MFHPQRVANWLFKGDTYPIYAEISPSGACNQRCIFCALDFMGYQKRFLDADILKKRFKDMAHNGLKSIMFGGEGEPFLNPRFTEIVKSAFDAGLDIGITTNGSFLNEPQRIIPYCKWIKISVDAGTKSTYAKIHGIKPEWFDKIIYNIAKAVCIKKDKDLKCSLGIQAILMPENSSEMELLALMAKNIGVDYLVIKPYSQHPLSGKHVNTNNILTNRDHALAVSDDKFKVIWRDNALSKIDKKREYSECLAMPFWTYIDAGGNVWGCSNFLGDERFKYGNIYEKSLTEIWDNRQKIDFNLNECRMACRMDECNRYLWELKYPGPHVNFI